MRSPRTIVAPAAARDPGRSARGALSGGVVALALSILATLLLQVAPARGAEAATATSPWTATGWLKVQVTSTWQIGCTAFVTNSANRSVISTAGHCVRPNGLTPIGYTFYPGGLNGGRGSFAAGPADVYVDGRFVTGREAYDVAFIVVHNAVVTGPSVSAAAGGGLPMLFNPPYNATATMYGMPGSSTVIRSCGPSGTSTYIGSSWVIGDPAAMKMQNGCNFGAGSSGGPWLDSQGRAVAVIAQQISDCIVCGTYNTGTYLGAAALTQFNAAQGAFVPGRWYSVINRNSGKCVDARGGGIANGTAIQQYSCNDTFAQQFQFQAIGGGYYRVANRNAPNQVWDVKAVSQLNGALVELWANNGGLNQQWSLVSEGGGYYHIVVKHSLKCLDVPHFSTLDSIQLEQWSCNGGTNQSFALVPR